jgi:hypothetical protein
LTGAPRDGRLEGIERALAYPYSIPSGSYVFDGEDAIPLDDYFSERGISFSELISGRTPVLAAGSNASPYQLRTKRERFGLAGEIPVIKARLSGFDVVYSARITSYGSVPATLRPSPGTAVDLFVTFLNEEQLFPMDKSEDAHIKNGNYRRELFTGGGLEMEEEIDPGEVWVYQSNRGCLLLGGECAALSAISVQGRRLPALSQKEVQEWVRDHLVPGAPLDEFIRENIGDKAIRDARNERLKEWAGEGDWAVEGGQVVDAP